MWKLFYTFILIASIVEAKPPRTDLTVSGLSSGGAMAAQFHLAFSADVSGAGIVAGPPYYCAQGNLIFALSECLYGPAVLIPITKLLGQLTSYVQAGSADPTSHIKNDPVYIFSGTSDHVVAQDVVKINEQIYTTLGAHVQTNYAVPANHGFITDHYGGQCEILDTQYYINNCSFDLAYALLNHIFGGNLTKPSPSKPVPIKGQFVTIPQPTMINPEAVPATDLKGTNIFSYWAKLIQTSMAAHSSSLGFNKFPTLTLPGFTGPSSVGASGFDTEGFVYYPSNCTKGKKCPIHVALHGCMQGRAKVGDVFAKNTGYLEVAELNHIIIFFPQIVPTYFDPINAEGCWDWWGYGGPNYANKLGTQMSGVMQMVRSIRAINDALVA